MTRNTSSRTAFALALAAVAAAATVTSARAGEFFEKDGAALRGYDAVAYFKEGKPVKGSPAHRVEYKGSTFHFSSQANRNAFAAEPARYAPQYGGWPTTIILTGRRQLS